MFSEIIDLLNPWKDENVDKAILLLIARAKKIAAKFLLQCIPKEFFTNSAPPEVSKVSTLWIDVYCANTLTKEPINSRVYGRHSNIQEMLQFAKLCKFSSDATGNLSKYIKNQTDKNVNLMMRADRALSKLDEWKENYDSVKKALLRDLCTLLSNVNSLPRQKDEMIYFLRQCDKLEEGETLAAPFVSFLSSSTCMAPAIQHILTTCSNLKFPSIKQIAEKQRSNLLRKFEKTKPVAPWAMPNATLIGNCLNKVDITLFLKGNQQSMTQRGFTSIKLARGFRLQGTGFSVSYNAKGVGRNAYVEIVKTHAIYEEMKQEHANAIQELRALERLYPPPPYPDAELEVALPILPMKRDGSYIPANEPPKKLEVYDLSGE